MEFIGEYGTDTGGLTREFFILVGYVINFKYLDSAGAFLHNAVALQVWLNLIICYNNNKDVIIIIAGTRILQTWYTSGYGFGSRWRSYSNFLSLCLSLSLWYESY